MNKQELIGKYEYMNHDCFRRVDVSEVLADLRQLDDPQLIKLKDVIARIENFDLATKAVWINEILYKLGSDYGLHKYYEGYKQGKLEGEWVGQQLKDADKIRQELNKPVVPQFVAGWLNYCKLTGVDLYHAFEMGDLYLGNYAYQKDYSKLKGYFETEENQELFARAWLDGYTVEKEKRYIVKVKGVEKGYDYLNYRISLDSWFFSGESEPEDFRTKHTRKQLERGGFGDVFNNPMFEVVEVE